MPIETELDTSGTMRAARAASASRKGGGAGTPLTLQVDRAAGSELGSDSASERSSVAPSPGPVTSREQRHVAEGGQPAGRVLKRKAPARPPSIQKHTMIQRPDGPEVPPAVVVPANLERGIASERGEQ